jgi:hypothetical protein
MTMYAPSDIHAMSAMPDGCGIAHEGPVLEPGEHWALDCLPCEAVLAGRLSKLGWSPRVDTVTLTCDERQLLETSSKEGSAATALLVKQLGAQLAQGLLHGAPQAAAAGPTAPTADQLVGALQELPQEQLAALLKSAGLAPETEPAPDVAAPRAATRRGPRKAAAAPDAEDK